MGMQYINAQIITQRAAIGSYNSDPIRTRYERAISLQAVSVGAGNLGAIKLQFSDDESNPTNWSDITGKTVSVSGAGVIAIEAFDICYEWIRAVYTDSGTSGGGTIAARAKTINFGLARD